MERGDAAARRVRVLGAHVCAPSSLSITPTATSVGCEYAVPCGYAAALPERLATGEFNVYRCAAQMKEVKAR